MTVVEGKDGGNAKGRRWGCVRPERCIPGRRYAASFPSIGQRKRKCSPSDWRLFNPIRAMLLVVKAQGLTTRLIPHTCHPTARHSSSDAPYSTSLPAHSSALLSPSTHSHSTLRKSTGRGLPCLCLTESDRPWRAAHRDSPFLF